MWSDDAGTARPDVRDRTSAAPGATEITQPIRPLRDTVRTGGASPVPPPIEQPVLARLLVDRHGTILAFDRGAEELTGWSAVEIAGQWRDVHDGGPLARALSAPATTPDGAAGEPRPLLRLERKDGGRVDVEVRVVPVDDDGRHLRVDVLRVVRTLPPVSLIESGLGEIDPVTGLVGPVLFRETLEGALAAGGERTTPVSVMLVDVDRREELVERCGEDRWTRALGAIAALVLEVARPEDLVARLGEGTFGVLAPDLDAGSARTLAGRVRRRIEESGKQIDLAGNVTVSIGVASWPWVGRDAEDLLRRAGEALGEAHRLGGNRVWSYVRRPRVPVSIPVRFDTPESPALGTILDLSHSGMFVSAQAPLRPGMRLALAFRLPGEDESIRLLGRVAREAGEDGPAEASDGIGIEFEKISDADRRRLEAFLYERRRAS